MHCLVSKWSPPDEKGKFIATLLGGNLGTVFTFQFSGILTPIIGWRMVFYGQAIFILIILFLWIFLVANSPSEHHFISDKELQYIEQSLSGCVSKKRVSSNFLIYLCINKLITNIFFINFRTPGSSTIFSNHQITPVHCTPHFALWQFVGSVFLTNDCTSIYGWITELWF